MAVSRAFVVVLAFSSVIAVGSVDVVPAAVAQSNRDEAPILLRRATPFVPSPNFVDVGDHLPTFSIVTIDGREINSADLAGKVVVLNFWSTWCPPCVEELPRLEHELWQPNRHKPDFVLLTVAQGQPSFQIRPFIREH